MPSPSPSAYAGRGARLLAQILDGLIGGIPAVILWSMTFAPLMAALRNAQMSGIPLEAPSFNTGTLLALMLWIVCYTAIQWTYLTTRGQSLGKMIMKVKVVRFADGTNGGFVPNVLLRRIVNGLLSAVPFYGLVDILFIFRQDRRCIHDLIAGTVVVTSNI